MSMPFLAARSFPLMPTLCLVGIKEILNHFDASANYMQLALIDPLHKLRMKIAIRKSM